MKSIQEVIQTVASYPFEDVTKARDLIKVFIDDYAKNPITDNDQIRQMIKDELRILKDKITERQQNEFIVLPENFDAKYGHWLVLQWILSRHFIGVLKEHIPSFYFDLIAICNEKEKGRMCLSVVDRLLDKL